LRHAAPTPHRSTPPDPRASAPRVRQGTPTSSQPLDGEHPLVEGPSRSAAQPSNENSSGADDRTKLIRNEAATFLTIIARDGAVFVALAALRVLSTERSDLLSHSRRYETLCAQEEQRNKQLKQAKKKTHGR